MTSTETRSPLHLNAELTSTFLAHFIREEVTKTGFSKVVLGLSGGIDSALAAYLAVRALGPENVHVIGMPYKTSNPESMVHAKLCADALGLDFVVEEITPMADAYFDRHPELSAHRRGNIMARQRMIVLFDASAALPALVLGTSNKTELLLGYGTLHGDLASALNPLGDLYKTQVRQLSRHLGVPEPIITKPPSADLFEGQTDEADLGYTYEEVDRLLHVLVDERLTDAQIVELGFDAAMLDSVKGRIRRNHFKRKPPILPKISARTLDKDFHYMRDWGL
ncbi:NH(3)-dependent NAD(+) synthetase [compost metagenome]